LVKEKKGNDYILYDPYKYGGDGPDKEVLLTTRYKYNGATLEKEISAVLWFDSYSATPPEPPKMTKVPVPADNTCCTPPRTTWRCAPNPTSAVSFGNACWQAPN
jgi:hypothetical protein